MTLPKFSWLILIFSVLYFFNPGQVYACSFTASFTGDTIVASSDTITYTATSTSGHYYRWVISNGSLVSGGGTNSISVYWPTPGSGTVILTDSTSSCKDTKTQNIKIWLSARTLMATSYNLNGNAYASGGRWYLTPNVGGQSGSAWKKIQIDLNRNFDFTFTTNQYATGSPADGMMFVLQNSGASALGVGGGSMGYYGGSSGVFSQSVALELDIYNNGSNADSSASHLNLVKNDSYTPLRPQVNITSPTLANGKDRLVRVKWVHERNLLQIWFDGTLEYSWNNDIVKNVFKGNSKVWFGWTGGTGGLQAQQGFVDDSLKYGFPGISTPSDTFCSGDTAVLTAAAGIAYKWSNGASTRSIKITKPGSYAVTVTDSSHITQASDTVTMYQITKPSPTFTVSGGCLHSYLSITNSSTPTTGVSWKWDFGNGDKSTSYIPLYAYSTAGTYNLSLTQNKSGCEVTVSHSVTMYDLPSGINISKSSPFQGQFNTGDALTPDYACLGDTNSYQFTSPKGLSNSDYGTKWAISSFSFKTPFGTVCKDTALINPTPTRNMVFRTFPSATFSDSMLILNIRIKRMPGNCDTLLTRYIQVRPKAVSKFGFKNACKDFPLSFMDSSSVSGLTKVNQWAWDFGDGKSSTLQNPKHTYAAPGTYKVTLLAASDAGCSTPLTRTVAQYPDPKAAMSVATGCQSFPLPFADSSTIASGTIAGRLWKFGDGDTSTKTNPTHSYAKSGYFNVWLMTVSGNGCKDSAVQKIRILPKPTANFNLINACVGAVIYIANTSFDSTSGTKYLWEFGDKTSSTSAAPSHIYTANGTYQIKLTVTSSKGCMDSLAETITPYPKPMAVFFSGPACTGRTIVYKDTNKNEPNSVYAWNFGDKGTYTAKNSTATHNYSKAGSYAVHLEVDAPSGCADTFTRTIKVTDPPKAGFNAADACLGKPAAFGNTTTPSTGMSWEWRFGDGTATNTTQSPIHSYAKAGSYTVFLGASDANGCTDSISKAVNVNGIPVLSAWKTHIHNYTVTFTPADTSAAGYKWYFGTGDSSSLKKPVYVYPANPKNYKVTLVMTNASGCSAALSDSLRLNGTGIFDQRPETRDQRPFSIYPNPFEGKTNIQYRINVKSRVQISVYDVQGKLVCPVLDATQEPGNYNELFDAKKYPAREGIYFLKMMINDEVYMGKIVEMK